ncbi:signal peptide peptidase SppA [Halopenitus persicus]|uniref:signal peptide peptidase SppA n=1 Tax=Halopenitus persicus TaxID=1048396 RepID=UPI000BBA91E3|nr:signal peptide peptidase SppA [Halopenitus persicus]
MEIHNETLRGTLTLVAAVLAAAVGVAVGWIAFLEIPTTGPELAGVLLTIVLAAAAGKVGVSAVTNALAGYDVAEVTVEGPITRDGGRPSPVAAAAGATADEIVETIDRADDDPAVDALLLTLDTPGGEVLPSDDIRRAAERFDGVTIAHARDVCASGGYWIAAGCEEVWAHEASLVGSIGVRGSRPNAAELADKLGIRYEEFAAGRFKEAGNPLSETDDAEREYLQGIVDDLYGQFVATVSEGRDLDPDAVRETEARVFLGPDARDRGLVDDLGTSEDVADRLAERLDRDRAVEIREFEPRRGLTDRIGVGIRSVAYAFGSGIAGVVADSDSADLDLRAR